jgi:hypothetical protein
VDDRGEVSVALRVPGLADGAYHVTCWDTRDGREQSRFDAAAEGGAGLGFSVDLRGGDLALAINKL